MDLALALAVGAMLALFALIIDRRDQSRHHEVRAEIATLRSEMAGMRSDLLQVALAVGTKPRPQTG